MFVSCTFLLSMAVNSQSPYLGVNMHLFELVPPFAIYNCVSYLCNCCLMQFKSIQLYEYLSTVYRYDC
jgi:hypothetical protein